MIRTLAILVLVSSALAQAVTSGADGQISVVASSQSSGASGSSQAQQTGGGVIFSSTVITEAAATETVPVPVNPATISLLSSTVISEAATQETVPVPVASPTSQSPTYASSSSSVRPYSPIATPSYATPSYASVGPASRTSSAPVQVYTGAAVANKPVAALLAGAIAAVAMA